MNGPSIVMIQVATAHQRKRKIPNSPLPVTAPMTGAEKRCLSAYEVLRSTRLTIAMKPATEPTAVVYPQYLVLLSKTVIAMMRTMAATSWPIREATRSPENAPFSWFLSKETPARARAV